MAASSLQSVLNYSNGSNFTFNPALIEFVGGVAKLKLQSATEAFTQGFSSDAGFTYDSAKSEFTGGLLRQKDQRPATALLGASYTSSRDLNWASSGSLTANQVGTTTISGGKLEALSGNNGVNYNNALIGNIGNVGTLRWKYTPNYSGTPAQNTNLIELSPVSGNAGKLVLLHSASGGTLRMTSYNSAGSIIWTAVQVGVPAWNPTAGQEYEFLMTIDTLATGNVRVFIDGNFWGQPGAFSFDRGTTAVVLRVGTGSVYTFSNGSYADVILYSNILFSGNYTPGYTVPDFIYAETPATLPAFDHAFLGTFLSYDSMTTTEAGTPRYTVKTGSGANKYWDGSAWIASDGSYAQANSKATINANLASLTDAMGATQVTLRVVFGNSNTISSIDTLTFNTTANTEYPTSNPTIVDNAGILMDALESFELTAGSVTGALRFAVVVNGQDKYWDGDSWENSSSYAQTNTAAEINTNALSLNMANGKQVQIKVYLHSEDGQTTPEIETVTFGYNYYNNQANPPTCTVWGFYRDIGGNPISGATVTFKLKRTTGQYREAGNSIVEKQLTTTTDANGRFEMDLIRSSSYGDSAGTYEVTIVKTSENLKTDVISGSIPITFTVPDAAQVNITDRINEAA